MEESMLARLPPELRNQIYHHTFASKFAVKLDSGRIQHPLTRTCRQIRRETLQMYYIATSFNANLSDGPITPLLQWLQCIGPESVILVQQVRIWDMHHNVMNILSPDAGTRLLDCSEMDGVKRTLPLESSPPGDNALDPAQRAQLWSTLEGFGFGLRQLREQRYGSAIVHHTSTYVLSLAKEQKCC